MEEKETAKKEAQNEAQNEKIDPRLKDLIGIMKLIQKEMPNADPSERITVFLRYLEEQKHNNFGTEKQTVSTNPVNIESLVNALSFKTSKNGKSEFASIDKDLGAKLPQSFEYGGYNYYNKGDALIRVKKTPKQKKASQ